jgi:hypothetical protein
MVDPQVAEDFDEMRFAAAVKSADPGTGLFLAELIQIGLEHFDEARLVFAIANESLQLVAKSFQVGVVVAGNTFVGEVPRERVFVEEVAVFHDSARMGTAK